MVFSSFFGFTEHPFSNTPDPKYFFPTSTHQDSLTRLLDGIASKKGFLVLTGDVGTGKTTMCRTLLRRLKDEDTETALVLNPDLSETEILAAIVQDFGQEAEGASKGQLMDTLYLHLVRRARAGGNSLIVIDDAQNLPLRSLEQVRMISNFETEKEKLVQILLVGQPELNDKLQTPEFRQIRQRVAVYPQLAPLSARETREYVLHRLATAGGTPEKVSFTEKAYRRIFRETRGYPRSINTLCDKALAVASLRQQRTIDADIIEEQAGTMCLRPSLRARLAVHRRIVGFGAAAACALALLASALTFVARVPAAATRTADPDLRLQTKLSAVESSVASLEKRLDLLRHTPDITEPLIRQSEALETNLARARGEAQQLRTNLLQKEEQLRTLAAQRGAVPESAAALAAPGQGEIELKAEMEHFQAESRNRSEQIRHLEKALQALKERLTEAERLREETSRALREKEQSVAALGTGNSGAQSLKKLETENEQLRQSSKLLENLANQTIQVQSQEIERLKQENDQLRALDGTTGRLHATPQSVVMAR